MRRLLAPLAIAAVLSSAHAARAFCGFYASGAGAKVFNNATMVVLFRDGTRTVLSMANNYQGPPEDFAMVVPVPIVLQKENVKTLPRAVFDRIDQLAAPRLVEYWEQDPCASGIGLGEIGTLGHGAGNGFGSGNGKLEGSFGVEVKAEFAVGEYDIVILSAKESTGLDTWLREHGYHVPEGAEAVLRPYVEGGMYFFVARVDPSKVRFEHGMATLSPLRFHYDAPTFNLPVRLGLLNSPGTQDLIVHVLALHKRYEVANYPSAFIPTNLDVGEKTKGAFGAFYAALFDTTVAEQKGAVVTEYAWDAGSCNPCPVPPLDAGDVATLGADVTSGVKTSGAPQMSLGEVSVAPPGGLPPEVVTRVLRQNLGRFRVCYNDARAKEPSLGADMTAAFTIDAKGAVTGASADAQTPSDAGLATCVRGALQAMSFPAPEKGTPAVTVPLTFKPAGGPAPRGLVITRLHVRYTKDALGQGLIFQEAPPVAGGRERWHDGKLETGATPSETNNFQARYVIRHAWEGPVACDHPRRGVWGAAPGGHGASKPIAARDLAFAPRGGVSLGDFLPTAAAAEPPAADAGAPAPAPVTGKGCGACQAGGDTQGAGGLAAMAIAGALGAARRRRGSRAPG